MKKLYSVFRSRVGETLVESLAAVLIFTLASILLFTMVNSAKNLNKKVKESDQALSKELKATELQEKGTGTAGSVRVTPGSGEALPVNIFRTAEGTLYSYSLISEETD